MAAGQENGPIPLYMHTVQRVLREMRLLQQANGTAFDYREFKRRVLNSGLLPAQLEPLQQRLDILESFMPSQEAGPAAGKQKSKPKPRRLGSDWTPKVRTSLGLYDTGNMLMEKPSQLTIVDLSCPCISPDTASSLFNICFGIFMEQTTQVGRIVALDEAHKVRGYYRKYIHSY